MTTSTTSKENIATISKEKKIPMVSVFMVTYNHEKYIRQSLQGVIDQKADFEFEVIIGEDCSTDGTRAIVEEFERRYPSIIKPVYHKKNVGAIRNAYEFCYPLLSGKYVACLEGDDYWTDPYKLQKQVDFLEANRDFVLCFHRAMIEKDGVLVDNYLTNVPSDVTGQEDLIKENYILTASMLFRNRLGKLPSWFINAFPTDHALSILLSAGGYKIKMLDEVMSVYRIHAGGMWSLQDKVLFEQKYMWTLINCAKETNIRNDTFVKSVIEQLANSVVATGFSAINPLQFFLEVFWGIRTVTPSPRSVVHVFMLGVKAPVKLLLKKLRLR